MVKREEKTLLRGSNTVVCCETKTEEVKSVSSVGLWSDIDSWIGVVVSSGSEGDGGVWSAELLVAYLAPVCYLTNRENVLSAIICGGKSLVGLEPER